MNPTSEQTHILNLALTTKGNIMCNALAGTGKTTMLRVTERALDKAGVRPRLYLAFGKKIADDSTYRDIRRDEDPAEYEAAAAERMLSTTIVRTINGLGHRIWAQTCGKRQLTMPKNKSGDILRSMIDATPKADQGPIWDSFWEVVHGVGMAKALGYVPEGKFPNAKRLITQSAFHSRLEEEPDDLVSDLIDAVLVRSIQSAYQGVIDYNDQVYMPALFGGIFPKPPFIMIDEYQDLNPTNHAIIERLAKSGRLMGVGDPWQNIYGFRGAKQNGMAEAVEKYQMTNCDLSISFRCPSAVVEAARWRVPHFKWIKEGGHVETLHSLAVNDIDDASVFICRNNAPLFRLALNLLVAKRSVSVAGSDIGPKLLATMKKMGPGEMSQASLISAIDDWEAEKLAKSSTTAHDMAECMKVFATYGSTLSQAISYAEHLFAQRGAIRLLTGHKAKGLEFDTVYHLDPWLCKEDDQDLNLKYVIQTRSKDQLFEICTNQITWQ